MAAPMDTLAAKEFMMEEVPELLMQAAYRNLDHIGCENLIRFCKLHPEMDVYQLNKIIQKEINHMMPFSLISSVMLHACKLGGCTKEQILENLRGEELCVSVENVMVQGSARVQPEQFRATLYPPQQALLARMIYLEQMHPYQIGSRQYKIRIGVISERVCFGKTFVASALLANRREVQFPESESGVAIVPSSRVSLTELPMDIVICNLKTAAIWEANLTELTELRIHKITSLKMLATFQEMLEQNRLPDVLIVKDGKFQGKLAVTLVADLLAGNRVTRVLVDDYDILNMPRETELPHAKFYWLISSTRSGHKEDAPRRSKIGESETIEVMIHRMAIFDNLSNLRCATNYLTKEYQVPQIETYFREVFSGKKMCATCTSRTEAIWQVPCVDCIAHQSKPEQPICEPCQALMDGDAGEEEDLAEMCEECCQIMDDNWERANYLCNRCITADLGEVFEYCAKCKQTGIEDARDRVIAAIEDFLGDRKKCEPMAEVPRYYQKLLPGTADRPLPDDLPIKAIFLAEGNKIDWEFPTFTSVGLTHHNLKAFQDSEIQVGICKKLSGIDLSYVTHVIVTDLSDTDDIIQFIGRAQRLGRKHNLQVLVLQYL